MRQSEAQQWATLARVYFRSRDYSEVWDVIRANPSLRLVRAWGGGAQGMSPELLYGHLTACRHLVLNTLTWLPDNAWIKVTDLLALLRRVWPQFDAAFWTASYWGSGYSAWYLSKNGVKLAGEQDWQLAQGNFILTMLRGPLHWLGLVDLYTAGDALQAVRFYGLANLYLARAETVDLLHSGASAKPTATPQKAVAGGWRITPNLVRKAGGSRQKVLNIIEELNKLQRGGLPPDLVEQVKRWGAYYGEARAETVTLLEFRDAQVLAELRQRPDLEALLTPFRAGERALALVAAKRLAEVKKLLQALGVDVQDGLAK